jgi:hypothetical protein
LLNCSKKKIRRYPYEIINKNNAHSFLYKNFLVALPLFHNKGKKLAMTTKANMLQTNLPNWDLLRREKMIDKDKLKTIPNYKGLSIAMFPKTPGKYIYVPDGNILWDRSRITSEMEETIKRRGCIVVNLPDNKCKVMVLQIWLNEQKKKEEEKKEKEARAKEAKEPEKMEPEKTEQASGSSEETAETTETTEATQDEKMEQKYSSSADGDAAEGSMPDAKSDDAEKPEDKPDKPENGVDDGEAVDESEKKEEKKDENETDDETGETPKPKRGKAVVAKGDLILYLIFLFDLSFICPAGKKVAAKKGGVAKKAAAKKTAVTKKSTKKASGKKAVPKKGTKRQRDEEEDKEGNEESDKEDKKKRQKGDDAAGEETKKDEVVDVCIVN